MGAASPSPSPSPAQQAGERVAEIERRISQAQAKLEQQDRRIEQLGPEVDQRLARIDAIARQIDDLKAQESQSRLTNDIQTQQLALERSMAIAQMKEQLSRQQAGVAALSGKVEQDNAAGYDSDAFDQDRAALEAQREKLGRMQSELGSAEVEVGVAQSQEASAATQTGLERQVAIQSLEQERVAAETDYRRAQAGLEQAKQDESRARDELSSLEAERVSALNQLEQAGHTGQAAPGH
jgi:chromosome segregation ATPase